MGTIIVGLYPSTTLYPSSTLYPGATITAIADVTTSVTILRGLNTNKTLIANITARGIVLHGAEKALSENVTAGGSMSRHLAATKTISENVTALPLILHGTAKTITANVAVGKATFYNISKVITSNVRALPIILHGMTRTLTDSVRVRTLMLRKSKGILILHFYSTGSRKNPITIKENMYYKGSANLAANSQNLVNKLWVKGGIGVSEVFTQPITIGVDPIPLFYYPRSPITVTVDGVERTLGIQNITDVGVADFLINQEEKLLIPDLVTTGTGTISYCYEYPIKILLEEPTSQGQYGIFEDILNVDTDDKDLAIELGLKHLFKYAQPVISGSLSPFVGTFKAGETIKVEIPRLKINSDLLIKSVTLDSTPMVPIVINLDLETPERDLSNILKDLKKRLDKLEKDNYKDDEGPILKYIAKDEVYSWTEIIDTEVVGV